MTKNALKKGKSVQKNTAANSASKHWQMATVLHLVLAEQPIQLGWVFFEPNIQNAALSYGFRLEQIQVCNNVVAYILAYTYTYEYFDRFTVAQLSLIFPVCTFNFCGCWCHRWSLSRWSVQQTHWPQIQIGFEQFSIATVLFVCFTLNSAESLGQTGQSCEQRRVSKLNVNKLNV